MKWLPFGAALSPRAVASDPSDVGPPSIDAIPLLRLGFRPFYLLAALHTAVSVPLWVALHMGVVPAKLALPPLVWHAHEMVFGFVVTVITGFLLTAARNWTGQPTPSGWALAALAGLWLLVRVAFIAGPIGGAIGLELVFLGLVSGSLARVLGRARNRRNYFVVAVLLLLMLTDGLFLLALRGTVPISPLAPIEAALYIVVVLAMVMSGRVIPTFTKNAIPTARQFRSSILDQATVAASGLALLGALVQAPSDAVVVMSFAAATMHAIRLAGWNPLATAKHPILWILHLSYAWLPAGFVLIGLAALGRVSAQLALHAFSSGAIAGLIVGMITRTALGHTARPLIAGASEIAMYVLVIGAGVLRVFGPMAMPDWSVVVSAISAGFWSAAFLLYVVVYGPRLARARVDGKPG